MTHYAKSWMILLKYDEDRLELTKTKTPVKQVLSYEQAWNAINALKNELVEREEARELFGQERAEHLKGILGPCTWTSTCTVHCRAEQDHSWAARKTSLE